MNSPAETILSHLDHVRQRQPGQWSARCPAHQDRAPSLSVREAHDGSVLLHCFGGCRVGDVVAALELDMAALYPPRETTGREPKRTPRLLTASQALELLKAEVGLCAVAAANLAHGVALTEPDRGRLNQAAARIAWLHEESTTR